MQLRAKESFRKIETKIFTESISYSFPAQSYDFPIPLVYNSLPQKEARLPRECRGPGVQQTGSANRDEALSAAVCAGRKGKEAQQARVIHLT